ncbi:SAC3 domain-containing protein 1 isoform X2 [Zootermopsis nevadensis]|uniref:SAC3 domain-containing protein 1 isoform X2 n=1 Tax=Zootermopsis nevadensis TaxID=136037 RepID=UPI000B8ECD0D|nr:SAC3 domain-containing protein 1 isoform X2 [Zootermopsis nevadensis]XP_021927034.1 SAC3 domain-containing protein 1 isoform X2 [Zootermopsis nevadensis]
MYGHVPCKRTREKEGLLHLLELPAGTSLQSTPTAHPYLTVKSFSRSAAGHHTPHQDELRPPDILYKTVCHLLTSTVLRQGVDWCTVYDFVFDRLRAVRQDLVIQGLGCVESIPILEPTVRFHSYAGYRLCAEPLSKFEPAINCTHLLECLKRLLVLYDDCHNTSSLEVRADMEALYLLMGLGSYQTLSRALQLPGELRQHPTVKTAFAMSLALWSGNYVRLCTLLPKLPPLLKCVAAQQLPLVRRHALQIMSCAYSSHNLTFPLSRLQTLLLYKTHKQAESDCKRYGISVKDNAVMFNKATFQPNAHGPCLYVECVDMALQSVDLTELLLLKDRAPEPTETVK